MVEAKLIEHGHTGVEYWVIDCPYCGREHEHGAGPGHRWSHCIGDNPGYVLEPPPSTPH